MNKDNAIMPDAVKNILSMYKRALLDRRLSILWLSEEDYHAIQKINGYARFGFNKFPRIPKFIRNMEKMRKEMPAQGEQIMRFRRFDRQDTLTFGEV